MGTNFTKPEPQCKTLEGFPLITCPHIYFGQEGARWSIPSPSDALFSQVSSHIISVKRKYRSNYRARQKSVLPLTTKQALSNQPQLRSQGARYIRGSQPERYTGILREPFEKVPMPQTQCRRFWFNWSGKGWGFFFKVPPMIIMHTQDQNHHTRKGCEHSLFWKEFQHQQKECILNNYNTW